jgi:hypothetical protein
MYVRTNHMEVRKDLLCHIQTHTHTHTLTLSLSLLSLFSLSSLSLSLEHTQVSRQLLEPVDASGSGGGASSLGPGAYRCAATTGRPVEIPQSSPPGLSEASPPALTESSPPALTAARRSKSSETYGLESVVCVCVRASECVIVCPCVC